MDSQRVTVLGGTGKTGRRVVAELNEYGYRVRAASRGSTTTFDWDEESSWSAVLAGADAVYVVPHEAPGGNGRLAAFTRRAADSGVKRLVTISAREWVDTGLDEGLEREDIVRSAGTGWTVLRPVWFPQNFSEEAFLSDGISRGEVVFGSGDGRHPFADTEDIAAVAVAALTSDAHHAQCYELTGPRAITIGEAVGTIAVALNKPIRARPASREECRRHLVERYYSEDAVDRSIATCQLIRRGDDAHLSDGVQRATGRQPRDFADFAREAAAAGVWTSPW